MLSVARARFPGPRVQADLRHLPFAAGCACGVWASASLLHLDRDVLVPALAGIHAVLAPSGALFMSLKRGDGARWESAQYGAELPRWFAYYTEPGGRRRAHSDRVRNRGVRIARRQQGPLDHPDRARPWNSSARLAISATAGLAVATVVKPSLGRARSTDGGPGPMTEIDGCRRRRSPAALMLAVWLPLALSGCGDDGGAEGEPGAQDEQPATRKDGGSVPARADGGSIADAAVAKPKDGGARSDAGAVDADAPAAMDGGVASDAAADAAAADAPACAAGLDECAGACIELSSDEQHCGACDVACTTGQACELGQCRSQHGIAARVPVTSCAVPEPAPRLVSQTGCYTDVAARTPAAGLIPYAVASSLWADGTAKRRFLALPGTTTIGYRSDGVWDMPVGTVLIKEFLLETRRGDPASLRPLETRLLVRRSDRWEGFGYRWNESLGDAELENGAQVQFSVTDASGSPATYTHWFPSQNECRRCHNDSAGGALGLRTVQMNRDFDYEGSVDNQLRAFEHVGLFGGPLPADPASLPAMPDPLDAAAPPDARARSYLEGNCAHCHHPGGPTNRAIDLRYQTPFAQTAMCNARPEAGDLGVAGAAIVVPGRHDLSVLWLRIARRDNHKMPPIGSLLVDPDGSALLRDWIDGLPSCP